MAETKICDGCDKEIGVSETKCPACGVEFAELDETVTAVERAQAVIEKRRKRAEAAAAPPTPTVPVKEKGIARLRSLGRAFKKS